MSYGNEQEFSGQTAASRSQQAQQARQQAIAIQQQNAAVQQQREKAPSAVVKGSAQDIQVRAEAAQAEQQRLVQENIQQVGNTSNLFASQREQAIKSGNFDYGSVRSAFYTPPGTFVNEKGQVQTRPTTTAPQDLTSLTTKVTQPSTRTVPQTGKAPTDLSKGGITFEGKTYSYDDLFNNPNVPEYASIAVPLKGGGFTSETVRVPFKPAPKPQATTQGIKQTTNPNETLGNDIVSAVKANPSQYSSSYILSLYKKGVLNDQQINEIAVAQGVLTKTDNEVSSFLKVPFAGQKVQGGNIPSTSLVDVAVYLPIPLGIAEKGISLIKSIPSIFAKEFGVATEKVAEPLVSKVASKAGTSDIGTNVIKYTKDFQTQKNTQDLIREKQLSPGVTLSSNIITKEPTETTISLGTGLGKIVSKNKGTSALDILGKGPEEKPGPTEGKTISVGRGLQQIIREKEVPKAKTEQVQKTEQIEKTVQEQKEKTEAKTRTEQVTKTKQEEILVPKLGVKTVKTTQEQKAKQEEKTGVAVLINTTQKPKQKTREPIPIPAFLPLTTQTLPPTTKQRQLQRQPPSLITSLTTIIPPTRPSIKPPQQPTIEPPTKPPTTESPPVKKIPPDLFGTLGGSLTGGEGRGSSSGLTKTFRGNVPINDIVGIYNRSEISYGRKTVESKDRESSHALGRFVKTGKKGRIL